MLNKRFFTVLLPVALLAGTLGLLSGWQSPGTAHQAQVRLDLSQALANDPEVNVVHLCCDGVSAADRVSLQLVNPTDQVINFWSNEVGNYGNDTGIHYTLAPHSSRTVDFPLSWVSYDRTFHYMTESIARVKSDSYESMKDRIAALLANLQTPDTYYSAKYADTNPEPQQHSTVRGYW